MIQYLQQGGIPLAQYLPVTVSGGATGTAGTTTTKASSSSSSDLTDKDMLKMLEKLDGLPNDMAALTKDLQTFAVIDNLFNTGFNTSNIEVRYLQALNRMKTINFYKKSYDEAFDIVSKNGGLNEVAIAGNKLLAINKDQDIIYVDPEKITEVPEGYHILTNSQALALRANNAALVGNTDMIDLVKNGIGMESVTKMIKDSMINLGTSTASDEGYARTNGNQLISGLQAFQLAQQQSGQFDATVDNLYKGSYLTKSQANQALAALRYIYSTLPTNARTLLLTKTQNGTLDEAISLIGTLISSGLSDETKFNLDMDSASAAKIKAEKDKSGELNLNPAMMFLNDKGAEKELSIKAGTNDTLHISARVLPAMTHSGNPIGITTLDKLAGNTTFGGILDFNSVSMGNKTIEMEKLNNIIINGNQVYKAYLPLDLEKAAMGIQAPNFDWLAKMEVVRKEIKTTGAKTPDQINAIYEKHDMPKYLNADGSVNEQLYGAFAVMNGTGLFNSDDGDFSSLYFSEVKNKSDIDSAWRQIKGENTKETFDEDNWYDWNGHDEMYRGLVYIPIVSLDPNLAAVSGGDSPSINESTSNTLRYQAMLRLKTFNPAGQL